MRSDDSIELQILGLSEPTATSANASEKDSPDVSASDELVALLLKGSYEKVLSLPFAKQLLGTDCKELQDVDCTSLTDGCLETSIEANLQQLLLSDAMTLAERHSAVLGVSVACLQLFVQNNWVGPPTDQDPVCFLPEAYRRDKHMLLDHVTSTLSIDGESIYGLTRHPLYLFLASKLLQLCGRHLAALETVGWWQMRCVQIHQALLQERSPTLKTQVSEHISAMREKEVISGGKHRELAIQFHLEAGHLSYFYYESSQASDHMTQAESLSGLQVKLTGVLGKRTRFQDRDISQLTLDVTRSSDDPNQSKDDPNQSQDDANQSKDDPNQSQDDPKVIDPPALPERCLPKDLNLEDETVMECISFKEGQEMELLSAVEQAVVLACCYQKRKSHEDEGNITQEESLAYVTGVLRRPVNWCAQTKALLLRTYWEQGSMRRMERCIKQQEELVKQFRRPKPCALERLHLLYCLQLPPMWILEREQADLFQDMGANKAALDIYLRLQMWEEVIQCYASLGRRERAEKVIREQLARQETPSLWCYLGDVTRKREHYMTAWDLSRSRFPRAQKSLGYWFLQRGKYEEVLPCFKQSLEINPLQVGVWFSYGCAALAATQLTLAATAFRRCVDLNADNFEAWSNLATTYIKLKQKPRAFLTYHEALKCDYENWRIWENYMLVGTDCGEFMEVVRAYHRIMDLRDRHVDVEVLRVLVKAVCEDLLDAKGQPASNLLKSIKELFGRVTSKVHNNADIWRLYSQLSLVGSELSQEDHERSLQYLQKAHRCVTQSPNWERNQEGCVTIARETVELADAYLACIEGVTLDTKVVMMLSSAKLSVNSVLTNIKKQHTDGISNGLPSELEGPCADMEARLAQLVNKINSMQ